MTNHVHLVVEPGDRPEVISLLMKRLAGRQSAYVNKLERRSGTLWEGRFKASPVQRDDYLLACCRYVDLNPVKAGLVLSAEAYPWSGYRERVGLPVVRAILGVKLPPEAAADAMTTAGYVAFIAAGIGATEQKFLGEALERNRLTGTNRFVEEVESRHGLRVENRGRGRPVRTGEQSCSHYFKDRL